MSRRDPVRDSGMPTKKKVVISAPKKKVVLKKKVATKKAPKKKKKKKTKAQVHEELYNPTQLHDTVGNYLAQSLEEARGRTGDLTISTMTDGGNMLVGIRWPSFCLEYATHNTVCPLSKWLQIYGPTGIGKSGLAFEIMRWFVKYSGVGTYLEHESKLNKELAASIIGYDFGKYMGSIECDSPDIWQKEMQAVWKFWIKKMNGDSKVKPMGRIAPILVVVDSLLAKLLQETQDKITSTGAAGRGHPVEALSITRFIQGTAHKLRGWPFMVVTVNHQHVLKAEGGIEKTRRGGNMVNFQGSFEFEVNRIKRLRTASYDGNRLVIKVAKNSYGGDARKFVVDCTWFDEDYDIETEGSVTADTKFTGRRQRTIWDWHGATVRLLLDMDSSQGTEARKLTGLVKETDTKCHSHILGVTKTADDSKKQYWQLGRKIMHNPTMLRGLREIFSVRTRKEFKPGIDYRAQILDQKRAIVTEREAEEAANGG